MNAEIHKKMFWFLGIILFIFLLAWIDWKIGYELNFFVFYFIPIGLAAWFLGIETSIIVSIVCSFVWFYADKHSGHNYSSNFIIVWNTLIRLTSFMAISLSLHKINNLLKSEKSKAGKLQKALSEIRILESFLSICSVCKKIRDEDGSWQHMESYISEHSSTRFSHGYCPECARKALKEIRLT